MVTSGEEVKAVSIPKLFRAPVETASFSKDPVQYVSKNIQQHGPVFGGRIVTWPVIFVCDYEGVRSGLGDHGASLDSQRAYEIFSGLNLYGENVLFCSKDAHGPLKQKLEQCPVLDMKQFTTTPHAKTVDEVLTLFMKQIRVKEEMNVYDKVKAVASDILAITFWGASFEPSLDKGSFASGAEEFRQLQSKFWRASVSTGVKLELFGFKSAFTKGEKAKEKLLKRFKDVDAVRQKAAKCPFAGRANEAQTLTEEERLRHMLMFSSSMVSKAIASVIASFMLQMVRSPEVCTKLRQGLVENPSDEAYLDRVIEEVMRLHPPVMGCCRVATEDLVIQRRKIPEGSNVWFSFASANRDKAKFTNPDAFNPDRWLDTDTEGEEASTPHFTFGAFDHDCLGKGFAKRVIMQLARKLVMNFHWVLNVRSKDTEMRYLPVARPVDGLNVIIKPI